MRGTFFGLEIGRTGLTTAQFGLDKTSHNISIDFRFNLYDTVRNLQRSNLKIQL